MIAAGGMQKLSKERSDTRKKREIERMGQAKKEYWLANSNEEDIRGILPGSGKGLSRCHKETLSGSNDTQKDNEGRQCDKVPFFQGDPGTLIKGLTQNHTSLVLVVLLIMAVSWSEGSRRPHRLLPRPPSEECFDLSELEVNDQLLRHLVGKPMRWDRYPSVFLVEQLEPLNKSNNKRVRWHHKHSCPTLANHHHNHHHLAAKEDLNSRSISPWTYRIDVDETRYPEKLAFAECLCNGCIDTRTGTENLSLNSVLLEQTMMVLRRKPCSTSKKAYSFEIEYIKVPVGCTCAMAKTKN
ncbi:interleukin-17C-like [Protopterus annectens]|uniref:interleukin-17C-like n=1 Tax=Protopterus annectens TaxID=7888 RepID=UPI001CFA0751|nr:interleukin-17C-like [Protopterus annectens]